MCAPPPRGVRFDGTPPTPAPVCDTPLLLLPVSPCLPDAMPVADTETLLCGCRVSVPDAAGARAGAGLGPGLGPAGGHM